MPAIRRWSAPWGSCRRGAVTLVETPEDIERLDAADAELAFVTQTTLSVDDTRQMVEALKARFPAIVGPHKEDICYATTNRQGRCKRVAPLVDAMIVVGSPNSSNSQRLREVAEREGCPLVRLILRAEDIDWTLLRRRCAASASRPAPPRRRFSSRRSSTPSRNASPSRVETVSTADESVFFPLPRELRASRRRSSAWRSTRRSPTRSWPLSSPPTTSARSSSYKGIAEGVENSNYLLRTRPAPTS